MKKGIIAVIVVGLLAFAGSSFANEYVTKYKKNGVEHIVQNDNQISSSVAVISKEDAKNKMKHLKYNLPTYLPEGFSISEKVGYHEPPEEFPNGVKPNVELQKELHYRILNPNDTENLYEFYVKKGETKVISAGVEEIELEKGIKAEISIVEYNNTILLSWKQEGTSYMILGYGPKITKEEVLKIANSVN